MTSKITKLFLIGSFTASALFAGTIRSQGTAGATQLLIPVGAQNVATSTANVATVSGVEALYLNPAGVARFDKGFQGTASTLNYIADIKITYAGFVTNLGRAGSFGLALKSLDFGKIPVTTADATEGTGENFSPTFITAMMNYSKSFADRVDFGVNAKLVNETIINTSATGLCVDLGVQYKFADQPLAFGVVLRNLGNRMEYTGSDLEQKLTPQDAQSGTIEENFRVKSQAFDLPAVLDVSVDYSVIKGLDLMASYRNYSFGPNSYSLAGKFEVAGLGWVAGGTSVQSIADTKPDNISNTVWDEWTKTPFGVTFGAGVNVPLGSMNLGVAYSVQTATNYFNNNSTLQLSLEF
ncbi:MAG: hypothetical protein D6762_00395 [Candidatus Neomarinimicrobiota bacterium]|nr:MAG: hypothetical protein D6762_00395 [Candidatus Neomarinimicrobiota bacterium]